MEGRKEGRKEGRTEGTREVRKEGTEGKKEERKKGKNGATNERRKILYTASIRKRMRVSFWRITLVEKTGNSCSNGHRVKNQCSLRFPRHSSDCTMYNVHVYLHHCHLCRIRFPPGLAGLFPLTPKYGNVKGVGVGGGPLVTPCLSHNSNMKTEACNAVRNGCFYAYMEKQFSSGGCSLFDNYAPLNSCANPSYHKLRPFSPTCFHAPPFL